MIRKKTIEKLTIRNGIEKIQICSNARHYANIFAREYAKCQKWIQCKRKGNKEAKKNMIS